MIVTPGNYLTEGGEYVATIDRKVHRVICGWAWYGCIDALGLRGAMWDKDGRSESEGLSLAERVEERQCHEC